MSLLLVPDEEVGSAASRALTLELAQRHRSVLVLEPSLDGAAKIARKGNGMFRLHFRAARRTRVSSRSGAPPRWRSWRAASSFSRRWPIPNRDDGRGDRGAERRAHQRHPRGRGALGRRPRLVGGGGAARHAGDSGVPARRCPRRGGNRGGRRSPAARADARLARALRAGAAARPTSWGSLSRRRASEAPRTGTSPPPPASRRSTAWVRRAEERTRATSSCRSRICRRARPCSPRSWRTREGASPGSPGAPRALRFRRGAALAQRVWGSRTLQVPSTFDLQVVGHVGGLTAGAFADARARRLRARLPADEPRRPAATTRIFWPCCPEFRGRGLSVRLKLFQRRWCLDARHPDRSPGPTTRSSWPTPA